MAKFDLDPTINSHVSISLFRNVENIPELKNQLVSGELQCCLINAKLILDPFQVVVAANKACSSEHKATKSINTEILFNLSITRNITRSLQQFGIDEDTRNLLLVTVNNNCDDSADLKAKIGGELVDLSQLKEVQDLKAIKDAYKVGSEEEKSGDLLDSIVSRIAAKDML